MKLGYMTNAFGPLVGDGAGVTSVAGIRYVTMCNDEETISKIAEIGYQAIEMFDGNICRYEKTPDVLRDILAKNKVSLLGVYIGANFIYKDALEDELYRIDKVAALAKEVGAKHIVLGGGAIRGKGIQATDYDLLSEGLNQANEIIKGYGLIASYHPHLGSLVEKPEQIDKLFALTDIPFCPDIAHLVAGGSDALQLVKKYYDRIHYIHLKDLKDNEFVPLGKGNIDLNSIISFMKEKDYQGDWLAEIDGYSGDSYEACRTSYEYLTGKL